ncbi:MAG: molybdopterin cofactor-binding domain-containing protein [Bacteroidota bacterium]
MAKNPAKIPHESGAFHVTGEAVYVDDIGGDAQLLHGHVYTSPHAHARILSYDLSAARAMDGVHAVLDHTAIPGENNLGPVVHDELALAVDTVTFIGQAIFLIAADNEEIALKAAKEVQIEYEVLEPVLGIEAAMEKGTLLQPPRKIECGDVKAAIAQAPHVIEGTLHVGGQEHWYLETQACLAQPGEGDEMVCVSSTQHPSETQALVAEVLGLPRHGVTVQVRRMGGAFGGKETQANHVAVWSGLLAQATRRPVKIRLFRDDDQIMTGKPHPYLLFYKAGFDNDGRVLGIDVDLNSDAGAATDLTMAVLERAMFHSDNSYFIPNMRIIGRAWKTNVASNTAFRGFGGPQGMAGVETIMDRVARTLGKDPAEVRFLNFYGENDDNLTPYGEAVENNRLFMLWDQIQASSDYKARRKEIAEYNEKNEFTKRGISLTPVKFGISFTTSFLNQAGALVNVYQDGTVLVNHGGTEMGQGLYTKMKTIAAHEFGVSPARIKVNATDTSKVPNTSATAASAGTDLNGMAVKDAIDKLKARISEVAAKEFDKRFKGDNGNVPTQVADIVFEDDAIYDRAHPSRRMGFAEMMPLCVFSQVSLSATGLAKPPSPSARAR